MRVGTYTLRLKNHPRIVAGGSAVGKKEGEGPLKNYFDHCFTDTTLGEKSWEKAESDLQQEAVKSVLEKSGIKPSEIQYLFAGDLLNQCISSVFGLRSMNIPFLGTADLHRTHWQLPAAISAQQSDSFGFHSSMGGSGPPLHNGP